MPGAACQALKDLHLLMMSESRLKAVRDGQEAERLSGAGRGFVYLPRTLGKVMGAEGSTCWVPLR